MHHYMSLATDFGLVGSAVVLFIWGCSLIPLWTGRYSCMGLEGTGHQTAYFSLEKLKGGLISRTIGMVLYFFFIRRVLIHHVE